MLLHLWSGGRVSLYLIDRWWVRPLSAECVLKTRAKTDRERQMQGEGGRLWLIDCTSWAIRVRLIGCLSLHWTVISQGAPLWKPFKCQLIDIIVLKMTELLWYYRTQCAFPLWINGELNGNWQNVAIQRGETATTQKGMKDSRNGRKRSNRRKEYNVCVHCTSVSVCEC